LAQHEVLNCSFGTTAAGCADQRHEEQQSVGHRLGVLPRRCSGEPTTWCAPTAIDRPSQKTDAHDAVRPGCARGFSDGRGCSERRGWFVLAVRFLSGHEARMLLR
jgi:hypothetical protein